MSGIRERVQDKLDPGAGLPLAAVASESASAGRRAS